MGTNEATLSKTREAQERGRAAAAADTFEEAMAIYGGKPEALWRTLRKMGLEEDTRAKFGKPARTVGDTAAIVEDAEFLASLGEHPDNVVRRLGFKNFRSLERRLSRAGRYDIAARLFANDGMGTMGESHHSKKVLRAA